MVWILFWSGIVTQDPCDDLKNNYEKQRHQPLAISLGDLISYNSVDLLSSKIPTRFSLLWVACTGLPLLQTDSSLLPISKNIFSIRFS